MSKIITLIDLEEGQLRGNEFIILPNDSEEEVIVSLEDITLGVDQALKINDCFCELLEEMQITGTEEE